MFKLVAHILTLVVAIAAQQDPSINTPMSVVQCQPAQLTWTATKTPVFVSIIPAGKPGEAPLVDFGQQTGNSLTWVANITAGTGITCQVRDSQGAVAYSAPVTIQTSADSSCIEKGAPNPPPAGAIARRFVKDVKL